MRTLPIALLATLALASPAAAQEPVPVVYETASKWFTCTSTQDKVKNNGDPWGFADNAPTASFQSGAGCGFFDQGLLVSTIGGGNTLVDAVAEGTFEGPVKSLDVELHELVLSQVETATTGGVNFDVTLDIDGSEVINTTEQTPPLQAAPIPSATGASQSIKFGIDLTKLGLTGDVERSYRLSINTAYSDTAKAWVAGATEIPSNITFNPAKLSKPTVKK